MSLYHSTRSRAEECSAKEAIRQGLAPDGGLYVSDDLGSAKVDVDGLAELDYAAIARNVLGLLLPEYPTRLPPVWTRPIPARLRAPR